MVHEHSPNGPTAADEPAGPKPQGPMRLHAAELDGRQKRGLELCRAAEKANGLALLINDTTTLWHSLTDSTRSYLVVRDERNRRGKRQVEYRCQCGDFAKQGRVDCKHIFAEKVRRGEVTVAGTPESVEIMQLRFRTVGRRERPKQRMDAPAVLPGATRASRCSMRDIV